MQVLDLGFNLIQFDEFFDVRTIFGEIVKKKIVKSQHVIFSLFITGFGPWIQSDQSHTNIGL